MSRYDTIIELIKIFKPSSIVETGTWNGNNAGRMIAEASKHNEVSYTGYDLFETANEKTDAEEFNVKPHFTMAEVEKNLGRTGARITLIRGNTRETLKSHIADLAFIDGGHSLETIRHDYEALKHSNLIILDDFYVADSEGRMPDIQKVGCNLLVETLPHAIIPSQDRVEGGGVVNLAIVFGSHQETNMTIYRDGQWRDIPIEKYSSEFEVGKQYKTRLGVRVVILESDPYDAVMKVWRSDNNKVIQYYKNGELMTNQIGCDDIVGEWP